jgi:hypothetical protein
MLLLEIPYHASSRQLVSGGTQYYVMIWPADSHDCVGIAKLDYHLDPDEKPDVEIGKLYFRLIRVKKGS